MQDGRSYAECRSYAGSRSYAASRSYADVGAMQTVELLEVRPMKAVVIIQVIIMK